ncbi:MAG: HEPN domain-containing protein [Anaerolineae bacterium]
MKFSKAKESLQASEICFEQSLYNSAANRAYYAMFQAIAVALDKAGFGKKQWSHEGLQSTFSIALTRQRKIYPGNFTTYLCNALVQRNLADYADVDISKKRVKRMLEWPRKIVAKVEEVISYEDAG